MLVYGALFKDPRCSVNLALLHLYKGTVADETGKFVSSELRKSLFVCRSCLHLNLLRASLFFLLIVHEYECHFTIVRSPLVFMLLVFLYPSFTFLDHEIHVRLDIRHREYPAFQAKLHS